MAISFSDAQQEAFGVAVDGSVTDADAHRAAIAALSAIPRASASSTTKSAGTSGAISLPHPHCVSSTLADLHVGKSIRTSAGMEFPELIGRKGEDAVEAIKAARPDLNEVVALPADSMVTMYSSCQAMPVDTYLLAPS